MKGLRLTWGSSWLRQRRRQDLPERPGIPRAIRVQLRAPSFSTRSLSTASSSGDHGPLTLSSIVAFPADAAEAAASPPTEAPETTTTSSSSPEGGGEAWCDWGWGGGSVRVWVSTAIGVESEWAASATAGGFDGGFGAGETAVSGADMVPRAGLGSGAGAGAGWWGHETGRVFRRSAAFLFLAARLTRVPHAAGQSFLLPGQFFSWAVMRLCN